MYNRLKPGQPRAKEAIEMENTGVTCDVCECRLKVTEQCSCTTQQVETPHFCQNYEKK